MITEQVNLDCSTATSTSKNFTIAYASCYSSALAIVSIYSFYILFKYDLKFINASFCKKIWMWTKDVWKRRRCYIPLITHIVDQITDVVVAIQFYHLAKEKSANDYEQCGGLNIWYLFILTLLCMLIYRIISSYLLYLFTHKSLTHLIFQLLDIELFRALYINYLTNKTEPCDPQRFITAMEASLESAPQALIQMIYLVKTNSFSSSIIVLVSLISSIWCIITKLVSDDKSIVVEKAKRVKFEFGANVAVDLCAGVAIFIIVCLLCIVGTIVIGLLCALCPCIAICYCLFKDRINNCIEERRSQPREKEYEELYETKEQEDNDYQMLEYSISRLNIDSPGEIPELTVNKTIRDEEKDNEEEKKKILSKDINDHYQWISWWYILRFLWRILDVSSRIFIVTLCWMIIGGYSLTSIIAIESLAFLILAFKTKQWELLFGIVALVISFTSEKARNISWIIFVYRTVSNIILMILITIWFYVEFECPKCTDYMERKQLKENNYLFSMFIYCWICTLSTPTIMSILYFMDIFENETSLSRDLQQMIIAKNYNGIIEMQLYAQSYGYYDKQNKRSLLMLAMRQKRATIISYLLRQYQDLIPLDHQDTEGYNILDYYCRPAVDADDEGRSMSYSLLAIYKQLPSLKEKKGKNAFLCGCYNKQPDIIDVFSAYQHDIIFKSKDVDGKDFTDYLFSRSNKKMKQFKVFNFYKIYPSFIKQRYKTSPFFWCCKYGKKKDIEKLLRLYPQLLDTTDKDGDNLLDYYILNPKLLSTQTLINIYETNPNLTNLSSGGSKKNAFLCSVWAKDRQTVKVFRNKHEKIVESIDDEKKNMFSYDWYFDKDYIHQHALQLYEQHPYLVNQDGKSPFFHALRYNDKQVITTLIDKYPQLLNRIDDEGHTVLDYYLVLPDCLSDLQLMQIHKQNCNLKTRSDDMTLFLCACFHGNQVIVDQLVKLDANVLQQTNADLYNGSSIAKIANQYLFDNYLETKYKLSGPKPTTEIEVMQSEFTSNNFLGYGGFILPLLGINSAGKTTIRNQLEFIYGNGFTGMYNHQDNEIGTTYNVCKSFVGDYVQRTMYRLIRLCQQLYEQDPEINAQYKLYDDDSKEDDDIVQAVNLLQNHMRKEWGSVSDEGVNALKILWQNETIQSALNNNGSILEGTDNIQYFYQHLDRIACTDYRPTKQDILLVRYLTHRHSIPITRNFTIKERDVSVLEFGGDEWHRVRWIQITGNASYIVYVVSLSCYNERTQYNDDPNGMDLTIRVFDETINSESLENIPCYLLFTKFDIFSKKVLTTPITKASCLAGYNGSATDTEQSLEYIKQVFMGRNMNEERPIHIHVVNALNTNEVRKVFDEIGFKLPVIDL